jgi:hypothetical protein
MTSMQNTLSGAYLALLAPGLLRQCTNALQLAKQLSGCISDQLLCLSPFRSDKLSQIACPLASCMHSCCACIAATLSDNMCCAEALLAGPETGPHEQKQASGE